MITVRKRERTEGMRRVRRRHTFPVRGLPENSSTSTPEPSHSWCKRCLVVGYRIRFQYSNTWELKPRRDIPSGHERVLVTNPGRALGGDGATLIWRNSGRDVAFSNLGPEVDEATQLDVALRAFANEGFHYRRWVSRGQNWMTAKACITASSRGDIWGQMVLVLDSPNESDKQPLTVCSTRCCLRRGGLDWPH